MEIYKANDTHREIPDLHISATEPIPSMESASGFETQRDWEIAWRKKFSDQAAIIVKALVDSLPGGTIDALLVQLLDYKRSLFVVRHTD